MCRLVSGFALAFFAVFAAFLCRVSVGCVPPCVASRGAEARTCTGQRSSPCASRPARRPGLLASASVRRTRRSGGTSRMPRKVSFPWPPGAPSNLRRRPPAAAPRNLRCGPPAAAAPGKLRRRLPAAAPEALGRPSRRLPATAPAALANQRGGVLKLDREYRRSRSITRH